MDEIHTQEVTKDVHEVINDEVNQLPQVEVVDITPSTEVAEPEIVQTSEEGK